MPPLIAGQLVQKGRTRIQFPSLALMWCSGIFFPAEKYPAAWIYLRYNPLLHAIEAVRDVLLWHRPVNLHHLSTSTRSA